MKIRNSYETDLIHRHLEELGARPHFPPPKSIIHDPSQELLDDHQRLRIAFDRYMERWITEAV